MELRYRDATWLFSPGVLLIPETDVAFIGGGEHALAYDIQTPRQLWHEHASYFWGWQRHGDVVLMSAELELTAWTITGEKLWTTFVEPWWEYKVENGEVILDVMEVRSTFPPLWNGTLCPVVWEDGGGNPASYLNDKMPCRPWRTHSIASRYVRKCTARAIYSNSHN